MVLCGLYVPIFKICLAALIAATAAATVPSAHDVYSMDGRSGGWFHSRKRHMKSTPTIIIEMANALVHARYK